MRQQYLLSQMICILVSAFSSSGCTTVERNPVEPVNFHVMSEADLSIDMNAMAERIAGIAIVSLDQSLSAEQRRERILPLLNGIEQIAMGVRGEGVVTNYSVINRYMGSFLYDVANARKFANQQPPDLRPAERLIKSCLNCHESM